MRKILSIIVPSYNMEKYLPKCLGSLVVAPELMEKLEVLVINDGSKDRTSEIAHDFAAKWPGTFSVIDKENGHYGSCINIGLKVATGVYVKVLDADDYFDGAAFEKYLSNVSQLVFQNSNDSLPDVIINGMAEVDENGRVKNYPHITSCLNRVLGIKEQHLLDSYIFMHRVAYRRTNLLELSYKQTEGICYTDNEWVQVPFVNAKTFIAFDLILYYYLVGRAGQSIDGNVLSKNLSMWIIECKVLLGNCQRIKNCPSYTMTYMLRVAREVLKRIYSRIISDRRLPNEDRLIAELDDEILRNHYHLYCEMGEMCVRSHLFTFYYVVEWRRKQSRRTLKFMLYEVYETLVALRAKLYRLISIAVGA